MSSQKDRTSLLNLRPNISKVSSFSGEAKKVSQQLESMVNHCVGDNGLEVNIATPPVQPHIQILVNANMEAGREAELE